MARTKRSRISVKRVNRKKSHRMIDVATEGLLPDTDMGTPMMSSDVSLKSEKPKSNIKAWYGIIALVALLVIIVLIRRGYVVSALVDGKPIFSWQLQSTLSRRFGKQTLEGMITEKLISNEAAKSGVSVTGTDIDAREQEMVKNVGGNVSLDDLLKYQGLSKADFDNQIKLQLSVEKILGKNIQITDADIDNFIATNRATLVATEEGALKAEAKKALEDQQIGKKIQTWFTDVKNKAKIVRLFN